MDKIRITMDIHPGWFTEPAYDFELKKYQLLAYLQRKAAELDERRINPHLDELTGLRSHIGSFLTAREEFRKNLRRDITGLDLKKMEFSYEEMEKEQASVSFLLDLAGYSHRKIVQLENRFLEERLHLLEHLQLDVVGLLPDYVAEGYLLLRHQGDWHVFGYETSIITDGEGDKSIKAVAMEKLPVTLSNHEGNIKLSLVEKHRNKMPNPAVFAVTSSTEMPLFETMLPLSFVFLRKFL